MQNHEQNPCIHVQMFNQRWANRSASGFTGVQTEDEPGRHWGARRGGGEADSRRLRRKAWRRGVINYRCGNVV